MLSISYCRAAESMEERAGSKMVDSISRIILNISS